VTDLSDLEVTVQQEIDATLRAAPHVVLLGAGASKAALPNGDLHGRQVPLLRDVATDSTWPHGSLRTYAASQAPTSKRLTRACRTETPS
jgi:hypothetical protein